MVHPADGRSELTLAEARALATERQWQILVERGSALAEEQLLAEPEVAFHFADGLLRLGRLPEAAEIGEQVETLARREGNRPLILNAVNLVGMTLFESGRTDEAEARFGELLESATEWKNEEFAARASNNLGVIANVRGRRDLALTYYQRALAAYQRLGYLRGLAQTHHNVGISYRDLGFHEEADAHYRRAIGFAEEAGGCDDVIALSETERAMLLVRTGDATLAEALAGRARARFEEIGDPLGHAETFRVLAAAARSDGRTHVAMRYLDSALTVARAHEDSLLRAEIQRDRGTLLRERGDEPAAQEAFSDAAEHFRRIGAVAEADGILTTAAEEAPSGADSA